MEQRIPPSPTNSEMKWIETPRDSKIKRPYLLAKIVRPLPNNKIQYSSSYENKLVTLAVQHSRVYESSDGAIYSDMCEMTVLNEPEVLNNLIKRYSQDQIFTYIGPTLIVINPYKFLPKLFTKETMLAVRDRILNDQLQKQPPHVYMIAGKAYKSMLMNQDKQAIVISGESGAGKTQSTKYCMQILTALSNREAHPIQAKILACNPLLQAFGNSKTLRNDNSSRFGKYVRIFFGADNTIQGAIINSYLLQKSRVTSISLNERSFHIFYAATAAEVEGLKSAQKYEFLQQSKCYTSSHQDDKAYFLQVNKSMDAIGFKKEEQQMIWKLVSAILILGNIKFDDESHKLNESTPCTITSRVQLEQIARSISVQTELLQRVLLFEKRRFLKEYTMSPYNIDKCMANRNTLSKAIYNAIFQFVLHKIQVSLRPEKPQKYKSISILDIFGFENFTQNSFEQLCINFTNEKLLKLYNQYVFERQMELLKEDGLGKEIQSIKPPTNDQIIDTISGKLSLFSIINDLTMPQQFKDDDMIEGFKNKLKSRKIVQFSKINNAKFMVRHSQCDVTYSVKGFKVKNQDKVISEIEEIVNALFEHQNKDNFGKTLLDKFSKDIDSLMSQLQTSKVHFIRCIKPNQRKIPDYPQHEYILSQVRYLGVFETIQIRKKTFPSRKTYKQFYDAYSILYPGLKQKKHKEGTIEILNNITNNQNAYLLGNLRVYINDEVESQLDRKLYKFMTLKNQKAILIQRAYKRCKFRKTIFRNLTTLAHRIRLWKKFALKQQLQITKKALNKIKSFAAQKKLKQLDQHKHKKQQEQKKLSVTKKSDKKNKIPQKLTAVIPIFNKIIKACVLKAIKESVSILDDSVVLDSTVIESGQSTENGNRVDIKVPKRKSIDDGKGQFHMNSSFLEQKSMYVSNKGVDSVFRRNLVVGFFEKARLISPQLQKLRMILSQKYRPEVTEGDEEYYSPNSEDCDFKVQECQPEILKSVISFSTSEFLKKVLRKRTNFIGMKKNEDQILVAKPRPMSKSLTRLTQSDEEEALKIFRVLVKVGDQMKLESVFKLIQSMIELCRSTTQQLKNEVFLMLLKQSNTPSQLAAIRIYQCLAVFLHIYSPDNDHLYAAMSIFFQKLGEQKLTEKEEEYVRYLFKKMLRIIHRPFNINYMPIKYQIMALMCKRQISLPVYLPIGNSVMTRVESYHTFADIKTRVMHQFGIDHKRLNPQYFTFFEIVNFQNQQLGESPINENQVVWDLMTYWEKAKQKYKEAQIIPPAFFLMLKVRYCYECYSEDQQSIELLFAQCYFDYFIGRIKLDIQQMAILAACIKILKLGHKPALEIVGAYPMWTIKDNKKEVLAQLMRQNVHLIEKQGLKEIEIKYKFLMIVQECQLALALAIPTQQPIKLFLKPKYIYLTEKCSILQEFSIRTVVKWAIDKEKFIFDVKSKEGKSRSQAIFTSHAHVCSEFLSLIPKLVASSGQTNQLLKNI